MKKKAVVLTSGGIDSTTSLAIAASEGYEIYALTFRYGQRHALEIDAARRISAVLGATKHLVIDIDLGKIGGSALTDDIAVPKRRGKEAIPAGIPVTYVPARNTVFLSYALAWAEVLGAEDIFIGVNAIDYSGISGLPPGIHRGLRKNGQPRYPESGRRKDADQDPGPPYPHDQGRNHPQGDRTRRGLFFHAQLL